MPRLSSLHQLVIMKSEFYWPISSADIAPRNNDALPWTDAKMRAFVDRMKLAYFMVLKREVPTDIAWLGIWPLTNIHVINFASEMKAACLATLMKVRADGLDMDLITMRMLTQNAYFHDFAYRMAQMYAYDMQAYDWRGAMELVYGDMDQRHVHFHIRVKGASGIEILVWLASDEHNAMPALQVTLRDMRDPRQLHVLPPNSCVRYYVNGFRVADGLHALSIIDRFSFINSHRGIDHEVPSEKEPILRFFRDFSMRDIRSVAEGMVSDDESSSSDDDMSGGPAVCGE